MRALLSLNSFTSCAGLMSAFSLRPRCTELNSGLEFGRGISIRTQERTQEVNQTWLIE